MKEMSVYDPAMCCSTGVCGADVDPRLVRFTADLEWLGAQGISVRRFNLAQEPGAFVEDKAAKAVLEVDGEAGLPLIKVDGKVVSAGAYPTREELAGWAGLPSAHGDGCCSATAEVEAKDESSCCGSEKMAQKSSCC